MATDVQRILGGQVPHTSGIYADPLLDGDEIGTLVVIVDRAKNLPNRRTIGKQDPYCAARLGKEAQKTETDRRGGQTPRWDQELRFAVHESPDYHNLKLSLFNDDKKAELIGETWINLDEVLKRGGGQSDNWHALNCKNKYAGEVRIELTFYDSRPRSGKSREAAKERKRSVADGTDADTNRGTLGRRQLSPVKRRPLPNDQFGASIGSVRSEHEHDYAHTSQPFDPDSFGQQPTQFEPPSFQQSSQSDLDDLEPSVGHHVSLRHPSPRRKPVQQSYESNETYSTAPEYVEVDDEIMEYTDDPYALEAVDAGQDQHSGLRSSVWPSQPRYNRIDDLSNDALNNPQPPPLPHAQSAPILGDHAHYAPSREYSGGYTEHQQPGYLHSPRNPGEYPASPNGASYGADSRYDTQPDRYNNHAAPPPPPMHRSSAPPTAVYNTPPMPRNQSNPNYRPLHTAASTGGMRSGQDRYTTRQKLSRQNYTHDFSQQRARTPEQHPDWKQSPGNPDYNRASPNEARYEKKENTAVYEYDAVFTGPQPQNRHEWRYADQPRQQMISPLYYHDANGQQYQQPPLHRSQGMPAASRARVNGSSPHAQGTPTSKTLTPRKSIDPYQSSHPRQPTTPFSPESYTPQQSHSNHASPLPSPHPPTPFENAHPTPSPRHEASPILRSDGKEVDPADQLPTTSWAPEPERKPNSRPNVVVNVKRFGPRSAPATPVTVRPQLGTGPASPGSPHTPNVASAVTSRMQQASPRGNGGNSPLAPSSAQVLSSGYSAAHPPPVPGKIPLGYSGGGEDYGAMSALSQEMRGIDLGIERPASGQRVRRSRFGA